MSTENNFFNITGTSEYVYTIIGCACYIFMRETLYMLTVLKHVVGHVIAFIWKIAVVHQKLIDVNKNAILPVFFYKKNSFFIIGKLIFFD